MKLKTLSSSKWGASAATTLNAWAVVGHTNSASTDHGADATHQSTDAIYGRKKSIKKEEAWHLEWG
jgi:hypothetical protein